MIDGAEDDVNSMTEQVASVPKGDEEGAIDLSQVRYVDLRDGYVDVHLSNGTGSPKVLRLNGSAAAAFLQDFRTAALKSNLTDGKSTE